MGWPGQALLLCPSVRCGRAQNIRRTCPARASIVSQLNQLPRIDSLTGGRQPLSLPAMWGLRGDKTTLCDRRRRAPQKACVLCRLTAYCTLVSDTNFYELMRGERRERFPPAGLGVGVLVVVWTKVLFDFSFAYFLSFLTWCFSLPTNQQYV
jgi:hypothetical protein